MKAGIRTKKETDERFPPFKHADLLSEAQYLYTQTRVKECTNKIETKKRKIVNIEATTKQVARDVTYFSQVLDKLEEGKEQECVICYDELKEPCMTACGHYFCFHCLSSWFIAGNTACPACRAPASRDKLTKFELSSGSEAKKEELDEDILDKVYTKRNYPFKEIEAGDIGTKCSNMLAYMKWVMSQQDDAKFIVFSQYHNMLKIIGSVLNNGGISSVFCEGSVYLKNRSIKAFTADPKIKAILLSLSHSASGTNLTQATHIILIEPVAGGVEHAQTVERQAIGRAYRLGQTRTVTLIRFLVQDTIEQEIFEMNSGLFAQQLLRDIDHTISDAGAS